jgi:hypothetical protein
MGLAINDRNYLEGYKQCLDFYRDKAIRPDGRVISRWAYDNSDAMPGTATPEGFYEAQWGYLFDSNPDFVINVADLYNQCGDLDWVRGQKTACEKALDYLLKRDTNGNHLVEMMTADHTDRKGSDWIDIIWASFENAFVNAELYHALMLWSDIEKQLGDPAKAGYYSSFAAGLKASFNQSTARGGFWDENNQWYIHWLDRDQSVHGNNLVVPVNFMAIAYGLCDNTLRRNAILDRIEMQMQKENLFAWPICMYTYEQGEGNDWQFPFPAYENGDIFLSWGAVGVEAYASYKPELAVKYIENILARYEKDGLAFQRYGRANQDGMGDDILSGNSLAIIGLYKSIYGIDPMYNRLYIHPHLIPKLHGTTLNYEFRGENLKIRLDKDRNTVSGKQFELSSQGDFGFQAGPGVLEYFKAGSDTCTLKVKTSREDHLSIDVTRSSREEWRWTQVSSGKATFTIGSLQPDHRYVISVDGRDKQSVTSQKGGTITFSLNTGSHPAEVRVL